MSNNNTSTSIIIDGKECTMKEATNILQQQGKVFQSNFMTALVDAIVEAESAIASISKNGEGRPMLTQNVNCWEGETHIFGKLYAQRGSKNDSHDEQKAKLADTFPFSNGREYIVKEKQ